MCKSGCHANLYYPLALTSNLLTSGLRKKRPPIGLNGPATPYTKFNIVNFILNAPLPMNLAENYLFLLTFKPKSLLIRKETHRPPSLTDPSRSRLVEGAVSYCARIFLNLPMYLSTGTDILMRTF